MAAGLPASETDRHRRCSRPDPGRVRPGKELVATAIQRLSPRNRMRFEVVNCGALMWELLLSELFGHARGAFTGAIQRREGILGVADGGTVFLDEVGELSPEAQVMLLRFLANGEIGPAGSTRTMRVDVRVIAATHRSLEAGVEQGTFREDLYYRLRRVVLEVPPLRARREDIPLLLEHCRRRFNERYGLEVEGVTDPAMRRLKAYPWPGNVRELEAVLEQAMILQGRGWLTPQDLDLRPVVRETADTSHAKPFSSGGPGLTEYQRRSPANRGTSREGASARPHGPVQDFPRVGAPTPPRAGPGGDACADRYLPGHPLCSVTDAGALQGSVRAVDSFHHRGCSTGRGGGASGLSPALRRIAPHRPIDSTSRIRWAT